MGRIQPISLNSMENVSGNWSNSHTSRPLRTQLKHVGAILTAVGVLWASQNTSAEPPTIESRLKQSQTAHAESLTENKEINIKVQELLQTLDATTREELGLNGDISQMTQEQGKRAINGLADKLKKWKIITDEEYKEITDWHWWDWLNWKVLLGVLILLSWGFTAGVASTMAVKVVLSPKEIALWLTGQAIKHAPVGDTRRIKFVDSVLQNLYKRVLRYKEQEKLLSQCMMGDLCIGEIDGHTRLFEYGWSEEESRFQIWREIIPTDKLPKKVKFLQKLPT